MNKPELEKQLIQFLGMLDQLTTLIDDKETEQARELYAQVKSALEEVVLPLRTSTHFDRAPHLVQAFLYPSLNEALLELTFPKGSKINSELEQTIYNAKASISYYIDQLQHLKC
jgi:hypothetical protein